MWILIISMYLHQPLGQSQSKGVIHAPQPNYETCIHERNRIQATWYTEGYKVSPRCVYIKYYSTHNGAYSKD